MPRKGLLGGGKISGSHSTLIEEAVPIVEAAKHIDTVKKVVLSVIMPVRVGPRRIKFMSVPAGLRVTVRGVHAAQKLFIYTDAGEGVSRILMSVWEDRVEKK